MNYQFNYINVH